MAWPDRSKSMVPNSLSAVLITRPLPSFAELVGAGSVGEDDGEDGDDFSASDLVPSEPADWLSALPHPATTIAVATTRPTSARILLAKHASVRRPLRQG